MTKRELVIEALSHKNSGKVPQAIHFTGDSYDNHGDRLMADFPNKQVQKDLESGRINKYQAVSLCIGNHLIYVNPPWWNWYNLTDVFHQEDPPDFLPDTAGFGSYEAFYEQMAYLREYYDVYLLAGIFGSHFEKAYFVRGIENFLADMAGNPEWAQSLLDLIIRKNMVMLENIVTAKELDGVILGSDWGTQIDLIMSPDCFRTMIKPGEQKEYDLLKKYGKNVFVHSCGKINRILDDLVEMGLECLNPVQSECMDLNFLKTTYGSSLSFFGGISTQRILPFGKPEEVAAETRRVIELMSRNGGYLSSPSQDIQKDVSYENIKALIDTAREYWL